MSTENSTSNGTPTTILTIPIPVAPEEILLSLTTHGFEAYVVGGCVRDSFLGLPVKDWDITTNATPGEVRDCFPSKHVLDFGIKHDTLAVLTDMGPVEITTYRSDSQDSLIEDLRLRDFTVNALAYHPERGLVDCFGGLADLEQRILRGTDDPDARLREDPLRILRALRLAATKGFHIEPATQAAMLHRHKMLRQSACERITAELMTFLRAPSLNEYLLNFRDIFAVILPEIIPSFDFDQKNPYHCYDIWRHSVESAECVTTTASYPLNPDDVSLLRLALLFHDLGKPACWSLDTRGIGHFYGHAEVSADIAAKALARLKIDNRTAAAVIALVRYHDTPIAATPKKILRWLRVLGPDNFCRLLHIKKADTLAHHPDSHNRLEEINRLYEVYLSLQEQSRCFTLRDLNINGNDLIAAGINAGPQVGHMLDMLLGKVMDGVCPNTRGALLEELLKERESCTR
ncbi:MAG: CCA tRNA nucleotidyltransferase [Peptococcaceae bacterium]|nr:CCA tRNA nucleotidyltransferase [Peptococcaceae bacterium]